MIYKGPEAQQEGEIEAGLPRECSTKVFFHFN